MLLEDVRVELEVAEVLVDVSAAELITVVGSALAEAPIPFNTTVIACYVRSLSIRYRVQRKLSSRSSTYGRS